MKLSGAVVALTLFGATVAQAQGTLPERVWRPVEGRCVEEINARYSCTTACNNRLWPMWARCTNAKLGYPWPRAKLDACIQQIDRRRQTQRLCELCGGDSVREAVVCANK
jgi:hypothetical protein